MPPRSAAHAKRCVLAMAAAGAMPPRRQVRRKDAPLYVQDETPEFVEALKSGSCQGVVDMLSAVTPEDADAWLRDPLDDSGRTSLHYALAGPQEAHLRLVRLLCGNRADVNAATTDGVQPIHLCAQRGNKYALRALCCAGADNLRQTADGRTTVDFAALNPSPMEMFEVVGWPGQGPRQDPLKPPRPPAASPVTQDPAGVWKPGASAPGPSGTGGRHSSPEAAAAAAAAAAAGESGKIAAGASADDSPSLTGPLLLAALWFAFLAVVAGVVIRNV